jgi:hypothetical protein
VAEFLMAFASDHGIDMIPILPCWGSPEVEALKLEIRASGGVYATDDCAVPR